MAAAHIRSRSAAHARVTALREAHAGRAGFLAALLMLAVQLLWRLNWSNGGVIPAFPELIVAAISRLTPLGVFGSATENLGSLAKQSLFVAVLIGIVAVGYGAGILAGRLGRALGRGLVGRVVAGLAVAAALLLFTLAVIAPIGHFGFFLSQSSYTGGILLRLLVSFAVFAIAWALLAGPAPIEVAAAAGGDPAISRRAVIQQAAWGGATLAAIAAVGGITWRLLNPRQNTVAGTGTGTSTAGGESLQEIVAHQRATQGLPTPVPQTPVTEVVEPDTASLLTDATTAPDTMALFAGLDKAQQITPILTATKDFYHVSKNISDPEVNRNKWKLTITGLVNKELTFTYDDLVKRATTKNITTLCCISNPINGDLISTAQWTGVPLVDLLKEAGVKPGVVDIMYHCADDYEDSIPIEKGMEDPNVMLVVGMDGAPLPDYHGAPARLIVPNIYGMKNAKWIERIELVGKPFMGYWESQGWSYTAITEIWGRIDSPQDGDKLKAGPATADGVAVAGNRGIKRVEVSLDGGDSWADAILEPSLNPPFTWVRWAYPFDAKPGKHTVVIRATDGTGKLMTKQNRDPLPGGATGWPSRDFQVKG